MARDSIIYGNEYRTAAVTESSLNRLYTLSNLSHSGRDGGSVETILTPVMYEQFHYQQSQYEELSRVHALFSDADLGTPFDWSSLLGMELHHAVRATMVLHTWVVQNEGHLDLGLLDHVNLEEVYRRLLPREHLAKMAAILTTTMNDARAE